MRILTPPLVAAFLLAGTLSVAVAQKAEKPWTEWSKKEAQKILDDSPWSQTQTDTDTSQMFYSPTQDPQRMGTTSNDSSRLSQGATNQSVNVKYTVRFYSARPVREAFVRLMVLAQAPPPDVLARLKNFAEAKPDQSIVMAVVYSSNDQRYGNQVMQAFNSAVSGTLKNNVYLERPDGKRQFLEEYYPPGKDGSGAHYVFLRTFEGKPFVDANTRELRFHAEYPGTPIKIDRRFKVADMMYQGELDY